jgi:ubiquilin
MFLSLPDIKEGHTIHLVRGAPKTPSGGSNVPSSSPPPQTSPNPSANLFGQGNAGAGGAGMFGGGGFGQFQQQMMNNPELMQNMMENPMIQNMMNDPETMRQVIRWWMRKEGDLIIIYGFY